MSCPICGGTMVGDGYTTLRHCEFARDEDIEGKEPDAGPVYCVEIVETPETEYEPCLVCGCTEPDSDGFCPQWESAMEIKK